MNRNNIAIRVHTVLRADLGCSVYGNNINTREVCVTASVCARCRGDDIRTCVMTTLTCLYGGNETRDSSRTIRTSPISLKLVCQMLV